MSSYLCVHKKTEWLHYCFLSCWRCQKKFKIHCKGCNAMYVVGLERSSNYTGNQGHNIFAYNFLNIQPISSPTKVLESWLCIVYVRHVEGVKRPFWASIPSTWFNIHRIWYGMVRKCQLFKTFSDWNIKKVMSKNLYVSCFDSFNM